MMRDPDHPRYPFDSGYTDDGRPLMAVDADSRARQIRTFNIKDCLAALDKPELRLQKTVRQKLQARIKQLRKAKP